MISFVTIIIASFILIGLAWSVFTFVGWVCWQCQHRKALRIAEASMFKTYTIDQYSVLKKVGARS